MERKGGREGGREGERRTGEAGSHRRSRTSHVSLDPRLVFECLLRNAHAVMASAKHKSYLRSDPRPQDSHRRPLSPRPTPPTPPQPLDLETNYDWCSMNACSTDTAPHSPIWTALSLACLQSTACACVRARIAPSISNHHYGLRHPKDSQISEVI